jgi:DNA-binding MarR family transcriptional regulator
VTRPRRRDPNVLLQVFVSGQLTAELLRRAFAGTGMTPDQFAVQSVVSVHGPITPSDLAARLGMAPTTVSTWLRRLVEAGHLQRRRNPADGRSWLVEVTPAGRRAFEQAVPGFAGALRRVDDELGADAADVSAAGMRLQEALRRILADNTNS